MRMVQRKLIFLSKPSLEDFSGEGPLTFPPAGRCCRRGGGGGYKGLRCHNMAQRWMKLDDFNHKLPRTPDTDLHVWMEAVGDDEDVDGQLMTVDGWYWR